MGYTDDIVAIRKRILCTNQGQQRELSEFERLVAHADTKFKSFHKERNRLALIAAMQHPDLTKTTIEWIDGLVQAKKWLPSPEEEKKFHLELMRLVGRENFPKPENRLPWFRMLYTGAAIIEGYAPGYPFYRQQYIQDLRYLEANHG